MQNLNLNNFVNETERESLKEAIFKRSREKTEALQKDLQNDFAQSLKSEIMASARESFKAPNNPFSTDNLKLEALNKIKNDSIKHAKNKLDTREVKQKLNKFKTYNNANVQELQVKKEIETTMLAARESLSNRKGFMGALDFLNAQATISLIEKKQGYFSALA